MERVRVDPTTLLPLNTSSADDEVASITMGSQVFAWDGRSPSALFSSPIATKPKPTRRPRLDNRSLSAKLFCPDELVVKQPTNCSRSVSESSESNLSTSSRTSILNIQQPSPVESISGASSERVVKLPQETSLVTVGDDVIDWQVMSPLPLKKSRGGWRKKSRGLWRGGAKVKGFIKPAVTLPRAGSEATAKEKGFSEGWTAFFCNSKRRWLIWAPDGTFFVSLGAARSYYDQVK